MIYAPSHEKPHESRPMPQRIMVHKILQTILLGFSKALYQSCTWEFYMSARRLRTEAYFVVAATVTASCGAAPNDVASARPVSQSAAARAMGDKVTKAPLPINQ